MNAYLLLGYYPYLFQYCSDNVNECISYAFFLDRSGL